VLISILSGASRIAYTRPGFMMKIPTSSMRKAPYLFRTGFGVELHRFDPFNSAQGIYFDMELGKNFTFGFSSVQTADSTAPALLGKTGYTPPVEFGFHLQQRVYTYNNVSLSLGLQDIVFQNAESGEGGLSLNPEQLSFFVVVSSEKDLGKYHLNTFMGFGSGGFAPTDTINTSVVEGSTSPDTETPTNEGTKSGVFMGVIMNTPYLNKWGGIDIVGEFDGTGINVGLRIPLTSDYRLNLGFTHIEKLPDWKSRYWEGHPGVTLGFDMAVPRGLKSAPSGSGGPSPFPGSQLKLPATGQYESLSSSMDATLSMADFAVHTVRDSMMMLKNEMRNLMVQLASMEQQSQFMEDSLLSMKLSRNVDEKNMNEAMRHLSKSLRYFYAGDYRVALQEVESALDLNPNMALAYARRGSVYYKLGDIQRATINWNLALRMDPEYDDVRNILKALHENRLKSTSVVEE
ncbi:MAG TPA: hypothetical protein QGH36_06025, partial [Candidatus Marinimicrobia bacterium]|nr:hypothetical protein [Candidatus Neomarinimicrobiota bacterium]